MGAHVRLHQESNVAAGTVLSSFHPPLVCSKLPEGGKGVGALRTIGETQSTYVRAERVVGHYLVQKACTWRRDLRRKENSSKLMRVNPAEVLGVLCQERFEVQPARVIREEFDDGGRFLDVR